MRPRIRTLKPEIWHDEAVGRLDMWERALYVGLITMADDEGRLLATSQAIIGHVFPFHKVADSRLRRWLLTLHERRLIVFYEIDGLPLVQIRNWAKHQRINRSSPSTLPAATAEANGRLL